MKSERFIEILKESFIKDDPTFELDDLLAYETKAVRLVQTGRVYREDIMKLPQFLGREWLLKDRTYTDPASGETHPTRWNMTTDGDYLLFTYNQMLYFIIEAEELDVQQARWSIEAFFKPTDDSVQRAELVKTLGEVLVKKMMLFIPTILTTIPRHADHLGSLSSRGSFSASKELVCKSTVSPFSSWTNP